MENNNDDIEVEDDPLDLSYLFFLLQGLRFKIIRLLRFNELTFKEIKERLQDSRYNFSLQRHLDFLYNKEIILKYYNNNRRNIVYGLTNLGKHVHDLSFSLNYTWKNRDYFTEHTILDLPIRFYLSIGSLHNNQVMKGRPKIVRKLIDMYKESKFIYSILYELEGTNDILDILKNKLNSFSYFHTKTIFGENSIVDPNREIDLEFFKTFKRNGKIEQKMMDIVKTSLVITDKSAFIAFPKENTEYTDTNVVIYSEENEFRNWCMDYFNHCWNHAKDFDPKGLRSLQE